MPTSTESSEPIAPPVHIENSTDATRGEPLALRAQKRKAELEAALDNLPADDRSRGDVELALATVASLLTGDLEHLSAATAADLNRWLESSKHLAEVATPATPADADADADAEPSS
ncbi:MAG: hypothetical protein ABI867_20435 [Kofleriaceae bacterium]